MTDDLRPDVPDGDDDVLSPALAAVLADAATWEPASDTAAEQVIEAIEAERRSLESTAAVVPISGPRRWIPSFVAGAAAALMLVFGAVVLTSLGDDDGSDEIVAGEVVGLSGTDLAPRAAATADISDTPLGTRIILDVSGLEAAPDGAYYEAWLRQSPEVGVSAGTFHMRGGEGEIELWAGVSLADYPLVTVTLQQEGGGAASSGVVVLKGSAG